MRRFKALQRVEISPLFVLLLCAYFYFDPEKTFFPFLLAVTAHEAGHLLALGLMKKKVHKIHFCMNGAVIHTSPLRYREELIAAAAGPAVNLFLLLSCTQAFPRFGLVNFCLFFYNLLPFYPLDGGRMLRSLLHLLLSEFAANIIEGVIRILCILFLGVFACYLTCVWHAGLWPVIVFGVLLLRVAGEVKAPQKGTEF